MSPLERMNAIRDKRNLSPVEKLVLFVLASYANRNGRCWPSQETIGEATGLARETVHRTIKSLEAKGALTCEGRKARAKTYVLSVTDDHKTPRRNVTDDHTSTSRGVIQDHASVIVDHLSCDVRSHKEDLRRGPTKGTTEEEETSKLSASSGGARERVRVAAPAPLDPNVEALLVWFKTRFKSERGATLIITPKSRRAAPKLLELQGDAHVRARCERAIADAPRENWHGFDGELWRLFENPNRYGSAPTKATTNGRWKQPAIADAPWRKTAKDAAE